MVFFPVLQNVPVAERPSPSTPALGSTWTMVAEVDAGLDVGQTK